MNQCKYHTKWTSENHNQFSHHLTYRIDCHIVSETHVTRSSYNSTRHIALLSES